MESLKNIGYLSATAPHEHGGSVVNTREEEHSYEFRELLEVLRRRKVALLLPIIILSFASAIVAWSSPAVYRSTATILIEQQEVPIDLVRSTVTSYADERIQMITQRVLTTPNLVKIIEKFNLYPDLRKKQGIDVVVGRVRGDFSVGQVRANQGRNNVTVAFTISYDSQSPGIAQEVATDLSSLYLEENLKTRAESASDTTAFLAAEAERLGSEISDLEAKIATFKEANMGRLPQQLDMNLQQMQRTEQQIQQVEQQIRSLQDRKIYLESAIAQLKANSQGGLNPLVVQVDTLKAQLRGLLAVYTSDHPDVKRLESEIEALETQMELALEEAKLAGNTSATNVPTDSSDLSLLAQYHSAEKEISALRLERTALQSKMQKYENRIEEIPQIEREYSLLIRDQQNMLAKYQEIRAKMSSARVAENLEKANKGERFLLIDPARLPTVPFKPNRKKILAFGLIGSVGVGLGAAFISDSLRKAVHGARGVTLLLGVPPLAVIPYIQNVRDRRRRFLNWLLVTLGILALFAATAIFVHFQIAPLDSLWTKLLSRLNIVWGGLAGQLDAILESLGASSN